MSSVLLQEIPVELFKRGCMNRFLKLTTILLLITFVLIACVPSLATQSFPATTSTPAPNRFATTKIESVGSSGVEGTFVARDNGDGTTTLGIQLSNAGDFNPWGIFATG